MKKTAQCAVILAAAAALVGCSSPFKQEATGGQVIVPEQFPGVADDKQGNYAAAAQWIQAWASREGTKKQQYLSGQIAAVAGSWNKTTDLALIKTDLSNSDEAKMVAQTFQSARKEDPENEPNVSLGVYGEDGRLLYKCIGGSKTESPTCSASKP